MPVVNLPDGRRINFPDTMQPEEIQTALQGIMGTGQDQLEAVATQKPQDQPDTLESISTALEGFTAEALNTFSFGLADKVATLGTQASESLFGPSGAPSPTERRKAFREENPKSAVIASIVGGIVNPVGQKVGGFIAQAPNLISAV